MGNLEQHFVGKVAQKALIVRDKEVLVTRDSRDEVWEMPGGRLNVAEDPKSGLARELREELGAEFVISGVFSVQQYHHKGEDEHGLLITYLAKEIDQISKHLVDPTEISQMAWVDKASWREREYFQEVKEVLEDYFSKQ